MLQMNLNQLIEGVPHIPVSVLEVISTEREVIRADSEYVFTSDEQAREGIWGLVQEIIELEKKSDVARNVPSTLDFNDPQYQSRLQTELMEHIENLDTFDFFGLLRNSCVQENFRRSRVTRHGEVILFSLSYFNPSDWIEQEAIEQKVGLEKKVSGVSRTTTYARTSGGLYFKIPYECFLFDTFPSLQNMPQAQPREVQNSLHKGDCNIDLCDAYGNVYSLCLTLPHLHSAWQQHILYRGGSLLGVPVVTEIDPSNHDALTRANAKYGATNSLKLTDVHKILYLRDQSFVMTLSLKTIANYSVAKKLITSCFP